MEKIQIPYIAYESALAREERTIKRLWILCIILTILLVATNLAWAIYESQFEDIYTSESVEVEAQDGGNALGIIGDDNEVDYGEGKSDENHKDKSEEGQ